MVKGEVNIYGPHLLSFLVTTYHSGDPQVLGKDIPGFFFFYETFYSGGKMINNDKFSKFNEIVSLYRILVGGNIFWQH